MSMTEEQIKEVLAEVKYKPGSRFFTQRWAYGSGLQSLDTQLILCLEVRVLDVETNKTTVLTFRHPMGWMPEKLKDLLDECRRTAHQCEEHEADEWLTYQGAKPFDPHRGEQTAIVRQQMADLDKLIAESLEYTAGNYLKDVPTQPKDPHQ